MFAFFVLLGELMPIGIARQRNDDAVTMSTAFAFVRQLLDKWSLPASGLQLEIIESALLDDARRARSALDELSSLGSVWRSTISGRATHRSRICGGSPSRRSRSKSFVSSMLASMEDAVIVRSTIELARNLGLETTAEGVEQESACRQLMAWGCHFAQGYLLGRPVEADELVNASLTLEASWRRLRALRAAPGR